MSTSSKKKPKQTPERILYNRAVEEMNAGNTGNKELLDQYENKPHLYSRRLKKILKSKSFDRCFWCDQPNRIDSRFTKRWRIDLILSCLNNGDPNSPDNQVAVCKRCYKTRYGDNYTDISSDTNWFQYCETNFIFANKEFVRSFLTDDKIEDWLKAYKKHRQELNKTDFKTRVKYYRIYARDFDSVPYEIRMRYQNPEANQTPRMCDSVRKSMHKYLLSAGNTNCIWCSKELDKETLTLDHIIPLSYGGSHWVKNIFSSCAECNRDRGNLPALIFQEYAKDPDVDMIKTILSELDGDSRGFQSYWNDNRKILKTILPEGTPLYLLQHQRA